MTRYTLEASKPAFWRDMQKEQELFKEVLDIEALKESLIELYEIVDNINEIVDGLSDYDQKYYKTYVYLQASIGVPLLVKKKRGGGDIMESSGDLSKVKSLNTAQNLGEKLALLSARENLSDGILVIARHDMNDPSLGGLYDKYRYVHRSQDGTNITVHYHRHYLTGGVRDFKIKR